jgi:hypothetical protein
MDYEKTNGAFIKHLKLAHDFFTYEDYFYATHPLEVCCICGVNRKKFIGNVQKDICSNKDCGIKKISIATSNYQKTNTNHNFSKKESREKVKQKQSFNKEHKIGYLYSTKHKERTSIFFTELNKINNPMKKESNKRKMKERKTGVALSDDHKSKISIGLTRFLENLTPEEFNLRMVNTSKIVDGEDFLKYLQSKPINITKMERISEIFGLAW